MLNSDHELNVTTLALTSFVLISNWDTNDFKKYFSSLYLLFKLPEASSINPTSAANMVHTKRVNGGVG